MTPLEAGNAFGKRPPSSYIQSPPIIVTTGPPDIATTLSIQATVTVGRLQALAENPVILTDPVLTIGTQRMVLKGRVESGEYLEYQGGDTVAVCDANWNRLRDLALAGPRIQVPTGLVTVMLDASSSGQKPWLEMQFTTEGDAMVVSRH